MREITEQCRAANCDKIIQVHKFGSQVCKMYMNPSAQFRNAGHAGAMFESCAYLESCRRFKGVAPSGKVRIGQQKQTKKK